MGTRAGTGGSRWIAAGGTSFSLLGPFSLLVLGCQAGAQGAGNGTSRDFGNPAAASDEQVGAADANVGASDEAGESDAQGGDELATRPSSEGVSADDGGDAGAELEAEDATDWSDCWPLCNSEIACETREDCPDEELNVKCVPARCGAAPTCVYAPHEDAVPQPSLACSCQGEVVSYGGELLAEPVAWVFSGLSACSACSDLDLGCARSTCLGVSCDPEVPSAPLRSVIRGSDLPLAEGTSLVLQNDRRVPSESAIVEGGAVEIWSADFRHVIIDTDSNGGCSEDERLLQFSTHLRPAESELVFRLEPDLDAPLCTTQVNLLESPDTVQCDEWFDSLSVTRELTTWPAPDTLGFEPLRGALVPAADLIEACSFTRFVLVGTEQATVARFESEGLRLLFVHAGDPDACSANGCQIAVYADTADGRYRDGYSKIFEDTALALGGIVSSDEGTWFVLRQLVPASATEMNGAFLVETTRDGNPPVVGGSVELESLFDR